MLKRAHNMGKKKLIFHISNYVGFHDSLDVYFSMIHIYNIILHSTEWNIKQKLINTSFNINSEKNPFSEKIKWNPHFGKTFQTNTPNLIEMNEYKKKSISDWSQPLLAPNWNFHGSFVQKFPTVFSRPFLFSAGGPRWKKSLLCPISRPLHCLIKLLNNF